MYLRKPPILLGILDSSELITIAKHFQQRAKLELQKMLNTATRNLPNIKVGDFVLFWRDNARWLVPAEVTEISDSVLTILHNGRTKTSSLNRVLLVMHPLPLSLSDGEYNENLYCVVILSVALFWSS